MTIEQRADQLVEERLRWLGEAERAKELISQLPEAVRLLEGHGDVSGKTLEIYVSGREAMEVCALNGTIFQKPHIGGSSGDFCSNGLLGDVKITAYKLPVPPNCRIEKEEYTATRYRAVCDETGEELG